MSMVEWKKLGDFIDYEQPTPYLVESTDYDDSYSIPVLTAGQSLLLGYTNETDGVYRASKHNPTIIFDDFTTSFHWIDFDFKIKSSAMKMLRPKIGVNFRYIYYTMLQINFVPTQHQRHWISKYSQFQVPIPSLSEQTRIVGILDTFTASIANLKEQIKERRKQYEHYRDQLLDLEGKEGVEMKALGDLGVFYGGLSGKTKDDFQDGNAKFITYTNIYSNPSLNLRCDDKVRIEAGEKQNTVQYGDVLFTGSSETPEECGMSSVVTEIIDEPIYLNSFCFGFRLNNKELFNPNFLKHYLRCNFMRTAIATTASGVTRYNVSKKRLGRIQILIPSLSEQSRIVNILDQFEASIANLEAQLQEREKQYEYYRNQLLTFE